MLEVPRYIVLFIMLLSVLLGIGASMHQFFRKSGTVKANKSLAFLLLTFSLSLFNVLLLRTRFFGAYQHLYQLPFWFTLSFGPLLFYYVKYKLFPTYQFKGSDLKHLILPIIQLVLVFTVALQEENRQFLIWENFIRPIYGPIEYSLFLVLFFVYATLSYRYIRYKLARLRKRGLFWELDKAWGLRKLVKRLMILAVIYSFFALTDFIAFHFFSRDLYQVEGFTFLGDIALTFMLLWILLSTYWSELFYFRGQKKLGEQLEFEVIKEKILKEKLYRNPDINALKLALFFKTSIRNIKQLFQENTNKSWKEWIIDQRLDDAKELVKYDRIDKENIAFIVGFRSKKWYKQLLKSSK